MAETETEIVGGNRARELGVLEAIERGRDISAGYLPLTFGAPARAAYLNEVELHGGLARAADVAGCSTQIARTYAARVPDFGAAVREAVSRYRDSLVQEATRRAVDGVQVARFDRDGNPAGKVTQYADGLLTKLIDRGDRIVGDLPSERNAGVSSLDATLVQKLSPEGRAALRIVLSELAGLLPTEEDMQREGISSAIDVQAQR
jgi:hypothetical protein